MEPATWPSSTCPSWYICWSTWPPGRLSNSLQLPSCKIKIFQTVLRIPNLQIRNFLIRVNWGFPGLFNGWTIQHDLVSRGVIIHKADCGLLESFLLHIMSYLRNSNQLFQWWIHQDVAYESENIWRNLTTFLSMHIRVRSNPWKKRRRKIRWRCLFNIL